MNKYLLKNITFDIIKNYDKGITKSEIKTKLVDYAWNNNIMTREFVIAFAEIGWVLQDLRQKDKTIDVDRFANRWIWFPV